MNPRFVNNIMQSDVKKQLISVKRFSINDLERFSQVKAHTIRIWEQRYRLLQPTRTLGNTRIYSFEEVQLLLQVALLTQNGIRISKLTKLSLASISQMLLDLKKEEERKQINIANLIIAMFSIDIDEMEELLDNSVMSFGIDVTITEIILPFMERVNLLSYTQSSSEIHLAVTAIRRKLILGIEKVNPPNTNGQTALLFLQKGEHYDLILLYMAYVLKTKGFKVIYMGTNISEENLLFMMEQKKPDHLFTYLPEGCPNKLAELPKRFKQQLPESKFWVVTAETATNKQLQSLSFIHYRDIAQSL